MHGAGARSGAGVPSGFLWVPAGTLSAASSGDGAAAMLGQRLGNRYGYPGVLRYCSLGPGSPGGKASHPEAMDSAVCAAVAGSTAAAAGWHRSRADNGNFTRIRAVTFAGEPFHALCVGCVDGPDLPGRHVRALLR